MEKKKTRVYFLDLGRLGTDMNLIVSNYTLGLKSNPTPAHVWSEMPVTAVLIDHPDGKILYDLGCDPDALSTWPSSVLDMNPPSHTAEQTLEHQLALCGTKPEEIKTVVISHMHLDHVGRLDLFRDKEIIVNETEFRDAFAYAFKQLNQEDAYLYLRKDLDVPVEKYTLINGDYELCDGVKILYLPGHTDGMCGLQIDLEDFGTMILTRDLCYTSLNYGPPIRTSGFCRNFEQYCGSIEKVRKLERETNGFVVFGHDINQFLSMKRAPDYYE